MRSLIFILLVSLLCVGSQGRTQDCPKDSADKPLKPSASRTLSGKLLWHDDLRSWFGLQLPHAVCGADEIQIIIMGSDKEDEQMRHVLQESRGCQLEVTGPLEIPLTGYFSALIYQSTSKIRVIEPCVKKELFPDYSAVKPKAGLEKYTVNMTFPYDGHEAPITAKITTKSEELKPWQAYASYYLTGSFGLYGHCADGFHATSVKGTPESKPWLIDGYIAMDPESAAAKHVKKMWLTYECEKD